MTFSLQKSTAMTDTQAANNKSSALNVKSDAAADIANDGESSTPESSFSKLFSLFSSDNNTADNATVKSNNSTAALAGESVATGPAAATLNSDDDIVTAGLINNADDVEVISGDELNEKSPSDSLPQNESSDDFLARLGQSSMLLQGNAASDAGKSVQGQANGNELPSATKGANIASSTSTSTSTSIDMTELSALESNAAKTTDVSDAGSDELTQALPMSELSTTSANATAPIDTITASTLAGMSTVAGLTDNNSRSAKDDLQATGDTINGDGSVNSEGLDGGAGKASLATGFGDAGMTKNTPFGQPNNMAAGINSAATESNDSARDQLSTTSAEPIEQLDFAQIMESARKPELLDQTTRTLAKAPILTDAEQQVLEKRVHLNNNLASSELNEKIAIMAGKELQTATIRLDPAELGSMNIKLVVQNDQINVTIQAQNNQSRDLLEQQMPRLREMLQQQGMTLGDTQVQADSGQQQSGFQQARQENGQKNSNNQANHAIDSQSEAPVTTPYWQDSAKGVDFYA
ncbi:flagellar hook-length control protein FliK [Moritella dasanensis]|uniref:flagellar hook-length control protein FliK n=1 Tax=Moritella dasanensis TaxID=428031 RepID=UPI00030E78D5|nr:flagellar hook-length control protein FliK [Moritella dasanensis]